MKGSEVFDPRSHYFVQRTRRFTFLEEWRKHRREVARGADVRMTRSETWRASLGFLAGGDSPVPMRVIDARIIQLAPGETTSTHRHAYDAIDFVLSGQGQTDIGEKRFAWSRFDALHTPSMSWHRHRNTGKQPARLLAITDAPLVAGFGLSRIDDIGDAVPEPDEPPRVPNTTGDGAYEMQLTAAEAAWRERREARRHTAFADITLRPSPKGSRSALLVDGSLGYRTTGLSMAMFEIAPGQAQSKHRHPGEAILYIVDGAGHSDIGDKRVDWLTGDAPIVHQYVWHQHHNDSSDRPATVLRMHMWESVIAMMQAAMDPVPLYEDTPDIEEKVRRVVSPG